MNFAGGNSMNMPNEDQVMHQVKAELATAYAQEFYNVSLPLKPKKSEFFCCSLSLSLSLSLTLAAAR